MLSPSFAFRWDLHAESLNCLIDNQLRRPHIQTARTYMIYIVACMHAY